MLVVNASLYVVQLRLIREFENGRAGSVAGPQ